MCASLQTIALSHAAAAALDSTELDVLVAAAGTNVAERRLDQLTPAAWETLLATNLSGVFHLVSAALLALRATRGLVIVVGSVSAAWPDRSGPGYQAAKAGVLAFTRGAALEEHERGAGPLLGGGARDGRHAAARAPPRAASARAARTHAATRGCGGSVRRVKEHR